MAEDPVVCYSYRTLGRLVEGLFLSIGGVFVCVELLRLLFFDGPRSSVVEVCFLAFMIFGSASLMTQGLVALTSFTFERLCLGGGRIVYYDRFGRKRVDAPTEEISALSTRFSLVAGGNRKFVVSGPTWRIAFSGYLRRCGEAMDRLRELHAQGGLIKPASTEAHPS